MKSFLGFACCLFIIGCTTVRPTDTMKFGPPHMRLSPEEMSKFHECLTELGVTPDINNSMEHSGPPMKRPCILACHLQAKGMELGGGDTTICNSAEVPGDKETCETCVAQAVGIEDKCEYAANFTGCIWHQLHGFGHMSTAMPMPE